MTGISSIGVDEVLRQRGYKFLSVVYQIDNGCRRLLWAGQDRTLKTMLDRFHLMAKMNKAIDEVRAQEAKAMKAQGLEPVLRNSRWSLLKRPENLTPKQWEYRSVSWAVGFLGDWCARVLRSHLEPMKKVARMQQSHRMLLLNWFRAKGELSSGAVEGMNNKLKVVTRRAFC